MIERVVFRLPEGGFGVVHLERRPGGWLVGWLAGRRAKRVGRAVRSLRSIAARIVPRSTSRSIGLASTCKPGGANGINW